VKVMGLYFYLIVNQDDELLFSILDAHKYSLYWLLYSWTHFFEWIRLFHLSNFAQEW
jgi:hypothetical protein